ncbi:diacylglycerol/lipid kinase family protein [Pseudochelatococcus lubricantis]|uniref:diacylglycerol/lipid kinase family protein n=1 Tax=Pseudochelatococcus lubricantis TaxID=1538102 RepID=UPI001421BB73|nr:diacylglycerol kinase family protein [Pseudochelatococcus lubricantis]
MRTRFCIIHNPNAGSETRRLYDAVLSRLRRSGSHIEVIETARHGEGMTAAEAAAKSGRFHAIVAAGGDGTVHDVAEGILGQSTPLGIIPVGTANVFSREIGLPRSPEALASTLFEGSERTIPVGEVNGRPFLFVVGVGFDAEAVRQFESKGTRSFGRTGLVGPVLRALASHRDRLLRMETDRGVTEARWIIVTRTKRYAANLMLAPEADLGEAQFQVLCMKGSGPLMRLAQLSTLAIGRLRFGPGVTLETAAWVKICGERDVPVQIDGEILGELPLDIRTHSRKLTLILPHVPSGCKGSD